MTQNRMNGKTNITIHNLYVKKIKYKKRINQRSDALNRSLGVSLCLFEQDTKSTLLKYFHTQFGTDWTMQLGDGYNFLITNIKEQTRLKDGLNVNESYRITFPLNCSRNNVMNKAKTGLIPKPRFSFPLLL